MIIDGKAIALVGVDEERRMSLFSIPPEPNSVEGRLARIEAAVDRIEQHLIKIRGIGGEQSAQVSL